MKRLVQASPQDLISWISPNAVYESELNTELQKDPIRADLLYVVRRKGRKVVFHIEIQKQHDKNMGRRVWEYNVSTTVYTGLPVYSVVLYLVKDSSIVEPPYTIDVSDDEIVHHFVFQNIKLWEIAPETLLEQDLPCLLPLLPLTEDGNRREVVQQMFRRLEQADKKNLFMIGYRFALRVLEEIDQQWLKEMFMNDENSFTPLEILEIFEGTWMEDAIIQKFLERGMKQGLEQGVKQGLEQGVKQGLEQGLEQELQALRATLLSFVEAHFPDQLVLARASASFTTTPLQVQELLQKLFAAHTGNEVREILLSIPHA
jgi:predicted transposase YdaD